MIDPTSSSTPRPKIELVNRQQLLLRTVDVEQLVPEDDPVRAIWELSGRLNLDRFYEAISSHEGEAGREAIDPRLLICVWVYAYSQGIGSAREVERLLDYHPGFQWLTGMRAINHHTLSDFRIRHKEALDDLFTQMLGVLSSEGLLTLERVMHDGTKVIASAGLGSFRQEERLKEHLRLAKEQVAHMDDPRTAQEVTPRLRAARERAAKDKQARLEQALVELERVRQQPGRRGPSKEARVSTTDSEARIMKGGDDGYHPSYNVQLSTDAAAGAVVSVDVSQSASDTGGLVQAVEQIEARLGEKPKQMMADSEYTTNENVIAMDQKKVDFIGSLRPPPWSLLRQPRRQPVFGPSAFAYEPLTNTVRCANGKTLHHVVTHVKYFHRTSEYRARAADCRPCPYRQLCSPRTPSRLFKRSEPIPIIAAFRARMQTEAVKEIYKQRGAVAEFTNAWIKEKLGLRRFRLRGCVKAGTEVLWATLTLNMQLWIRRIWQPRWAITAT